MLQIKTGQDFVNLVLNAYKREYASVFRKEDILKKRIIQINSAPLLKSANLKDSNLSIVISEHGRDMNINIEFKLTKDILREGLAFLYGNGHIHYNYQIPMFQELPAIESEDHVNCLGYYKRLAVESRDRNFHVYFVSTRSGSKLHNGSKFDPEFIRALAAKRIIDAKKLHHSACEKEEIDTNHHGYGKKGEWHALLRIGDENSQNAFTMQEYQKLKEVFYDQATIWSRCFKIEEMRKKSKSIDETVLEHIKRGFIIFDDLTQKEFVFIEKVISSEFTKSLWNEWIKINDEYKQFWLDSFGTTERTVDFNKWQPPIDIEELDKVMNFR